jgi:hypothetical protein
MKVSAASFPVTFSIIIDTYIPGDLKQPILKILFLFVQIDLLMEPEKSLLNYIHGVFLVSKVRISQLEDFSLETLGKYLKSFFFTLFDLGEKTLNIHIFFPDLLVHA